MKVFISWSGERSKALAASLKDWLPLILQYVEPWVSDKDISAGERWAQAIAGELETSNFGILCITPENIRSEWILFEAGALSKSMQDAKVIPLLFGLELSDLGGPLSQFQALKVDQQGLLDVAKAINAVAENKAANTTVEELVPALWGKLQQKLDAIPDKGPSGKHMRPQAEVLEDLVSQVRGLDARMRDFDPEIQEKEMRFGGTRNRDVDPHMIDEMMQMMISRQSRGSDVSLLLLAGLIRERMPWLAEVLIEAHRDLKVATPKQAREIGENLMFVVGTMTRSPWTERMIGRSKLGHMLMMELPMFVDMAVSRKIEDRGKSDPLV